jgi:hypothetical protein
MPKRIVIDHGTKKEEEVEIPGGPDGTAWLEEKSKTYDIRIGPKDANEKQLKKPRGIADITFAQASVAVHLIPKASVSPGKQEEAEAPEAPLPGGPGALREWASGQERANDFYLHCLVDAGKGNGFICSEAYKILKTIQSQSLKEIDGRADLTELFLPVVDLSPNSKYVYVDYRFVLHHRSGGAAKMNKRLEEGIPEAKYSKVSDLRERALMLFERPDPQQGKTYVGFKYGELVTWAYPGLDELEQLLLDPQTICTTVGSKATGSWQAGLWAMVLGLAESSRHHEWFYMGLMLIELVKGGNIKMSEVMNIDKLWPPQAQHAVAAMGRFRSGNASGEIDEQYLQRCAELLAWWLGARYLKDGSTLPVSQQDWSEFEAWAAAEIDAFVKGHNYL